MKAMKLLVVLGAFLTVDARANDLETAYVRFDEIRSSDAATTEKAYAAFEYFSIISKLEAKPESFEDCLRSISLGTGNSDPCVPVSARFAGGGTGGVDD